MSGMQITSPFAARNARARPADPGLDWRLRALSGYEEEALEQHGFVGRRESTANPIRVCNEILARCYVEPGADFAQALRHVHGLTVLARDAALLKLWVLSNGDELAHVLRCPHCAATNETVLRLTELPLFQLEVEPPKELGVTFTDGSKAELRLPSAFDQECLFAQADVTRAGRKTKLIAAVLTSLGEQSGPFGFEQVHALPSSKRQAIEEALDSAMADLDLSLTASCVGCARGFEQPFGVSDFFFLKW